MNDKGLQLGLSILRSLIIVIGAGLCILIAVKADGDESIDMGIANYGGMLDIAIYITNIVGVLCAAAAVIFGVIYFVNNLKGNMGSLIGIIAFVVLALVSFFVLSGNEVLKVYQSNDQVVTPMISQASGGGLILVYILSFIAIGAIVWTEVSKMIK